MTRRLLACPPLWFMSGVLLTSQMAGEPLRWRALLVVLFFLAFSAGVLHEALRRGGTLDLHDQLAAGPE